MKIETTVDNVGFRVIDLVPWPDVRNSSDVSIIQTKRDEHGNPISDVVIRYGRSQVSVEDARIWANAILTACNIADGIACGTYSNATCALCYHVGPCLFDGEADICADEMNCQERQQAQRTSAIDTNPEPPIGPQMSPDEWL